MKAFARIAALLALSIAVSALAEATAASAVATTPTTIHATYDVSKAGIQVGKVEERYQRIDDKYTLVSVTRAVGLFAWFKSGKIIVNSSGMITEHGLQPLIFDANNENNKDDRKHGDFDWATEQISVTRGSQHSTLELPDNTQDRLSAMYQFMFLPLEPQTITPFPMLNGHYLTDLNFEVSEGSSIKVPAGKFTTRYLDNQVQKKHERTELWLATQFYNLLVKMVITDGDGGELTQSLRKLQIDP